MKNGSARDNQRAGVLLDEGAKAASISLSVLAFRMASRRPFARAASCMSRTTLSELDIGRVHKQGDHLDVGNQLGQQLEPLGVKLAAENADARQVAARTGETGDEAGRDQVAATEEDDRDRRGCTFRRCYPSSCRLPRSRRLCG